MEHSMKMFEIQGICKERRVNSDTGQRREMEMYRVVLGIRGLRMLESGLFVVTSVNEIKHWIRWNSL